MIGPDLKTFSENFESEKTQLVWSWIVADTETPISAYLKLCADQQYSFLFESVEGGNTLGRYTILGFDPDLVWSLENNVVAINGKAVADTPLASLKQTVKSCYLDIIPEGLPPMASSGLFGFMGYDLIREVEKIPDSNPDNLKIPDSIFTRPQVLVIFDNVKHKICITSPVYAHKGNTKESARQAYDAATARIEAVITKLFAPYKIERTGKDLPGKLDFKSNMPKEKFFDMVAKTKEYILAGDIFQAVLSQRFSAAFPLPAFDFYRSLRRVNPSPFLFFVNYPAFALIGSSPEILVRVRDGKVTIRPIAGTRRRGKDKAEDDFLANDLLNDPKELAEHLMLLDLGRNDVGRVSEIGSVSVTEKFVIEYYSHVMHIISNVEGDLRKDVHPLDALMAGFPAGTVSGAPKIRAMEIIDELEPDKRKFYGGCVGYLAGNGTVDTCIALRTALIKDGQIHIQSGAGIVADSSAQAEFDETVAKARALTSAAEDALEQAFLSKKAHNEL